MRYGRSLLACVFAWTGAASLLAADAARFRTDSTLVLIHVTVTDNRGRLITTLGKENFQITENDRSQTVRYFSKEEAPVSVAIVVDLSNSMVEKIGTLRQAIVKFLDASNPEDEFCLIELRDRAELVMGFRSDRGEIDNRLREARAGGQTALLDGMFLGLEQMKKAHHSRKALLVISDGGDNHSRVTLSGVRQRALEADAEIYAIEIGPSASTWIPLQDGLLADLAEVTGGHDYAVDDPREAAEAAGKIGTELRSQYVLGYAPADLQRDGKYHRVRVKVVAPAGQPKLSADWRRWYYAPDDFAGDASLP